MTRVIAAICSPPLTHFTCDSPALARRGAEDARRPLVSYAIALLTSHFGPSDLYAQAVSPYASALERIGATGRRASPRSRTKCWSSEYHGAANPGSAEGSSWRTKS